MEKPIRSRMKKAAVRISYHNFFQNKEVLLSSLIFCGQ
jgi:hypothetical protein